MRKTRPPRMMCTGKQPGMPQAACSGATHRVVIGSGR